MRTVLPSTCVKNFTHMNWTCVISVAFQTCTNWGNRSVCDFPFPSQPVHKNLGFGELHKFLAKISQAVFKIIMSLYYSHTYDRVEIPSASSSERVNSHSTFSTQESI